MSYSKVGICNLALAAIGEDSIRDFDDGNKRARMCDRFYDVTRDYLLDQYNWSFARKQKELQQLAEPSDWTPDGTYTYAIPSDCHHPVDLWPEGSIQSFEIRGNELHCSLDSAQGDDVVLIYTTRVLDPTKYSSQFVNILSIALAVRICMPITQDKALTKTIFEQYKTEVREAWGTDAAIGNKHLHNDDNPEYDSFVDPDYSFTGG